MWMRMVITSLFNKENDGKTMLSLMYENGKAYYYNKDKKGNIVKGDAWDGNDEFLTQAVKDLNDISSTKEGNTVVNDLQTSQFSYNISEARELIASGFTAVDGTRGGGSIAYWQKGGAHGNAEKNRGAVVLGHELYHAWSYEFTNTTKGEDYGERLVRETAGVQFENYLRASFGETEMRTHYLLKGQNVKVASESVAIAKSYKLPVGSYMKYIGGDRPASRHSDGTAIKMPGAMIDSRKFKL